jgi:hypothetical protein
MTIIDYIIIVWVFSHFISHTKKAVSMVQESLDGIEIAGAFVGYFIHWACIIYGFFFYIWK